MAKTVRQYSVRHVIDTSTEFATERKLDITKAFPGVQWKSYTTVRPNGGRFSSGYKISLTSEINPHPETIKTTITLTNRNGKKFVKTSMTKMNSMGHGYGYIIHLADEEVGIGKEHIAVTLDYDMEVIGVFPKTRDFGVSDPELTDVVLVSEGQKFHVNKAILSTHSSYFRDLLTTGNGEHEFENVTAKVLQELLQVIYHAPEIYEDNVEELLEAARKFDFPLVTRACKKHIERSSCCIIDPELLAFSQGIQKDFGIQGDLDDVVLKVEDKRFHVNRGILATHSSYFYIMFFGGFRESGQSEIELKSVDPVAFQQFLEILYHCPNIHENNVENLLHLARIHDVQPVTAQCQKFIDGKNGLSMEEKQRLTEEYFPK